MTTFQSVCLGVFVALTAVTYRKQLWALVASRLDRVPSSEQSIALTIVNDLIAVTELRDKLAAENCAEGVEACTNLLRVIVEHTKKPVA
jgi:hypothetical protein